MCEHSMHLLTNVRCAYPTHHKRLGVPSIRHCGCDFELTIAQEDKALKFISISSLRLLLLDMGLNLCFFYSGVYRDAVSSF